MGMSVAVDPSLLSYQTIKDTLDYPVLEKLDRCKEFLVEDDELLETYEENFLELRDSLGPPTSAELTLALKILSQFLISEDRPVQNGKTVSSNLPKEIIKIVNELNGIHRKLVTATCQTNDSIVVIPDNSLNCLSEDELDIRAQLSSLLGRDVILYASEFAKPAPHFLTEGKSDWKHLKAALRWLRMNRKFIGLQIDVEEYEEAMGDGRLLKKCESASEVDEHRDETNPWRIIVCLFDRDHENTVNKVSDASNSYGYKKWCRDWFSFALPIPPHRPDASSRFYLSIEFYYDDDEIMLSDAHGRRLYLSTEFDLEGKIKPEGVKCNNGRYKSKTPLVIDEGVVKIEDERNVALPKNDFAEYILNGDPPFDSVRFDAFEKLFEVAETIIQENFP